MESPSTSNSAGGKARRLSRLFHRSGTLVLVPLDDSLISGPFDGLERMKPKTVQILEGGPDAIMLFRGHARLLQQHLAGTGLVLNITASVAGEYHAYHTRKVLASSVEDALELAAEAVAVHVNLTGRYEPEMLQQLGTVGRECDRWGMPCVAIMYPRREINGSDDNFESLQRTNPDSYARLVAHAARVGVDLGADVIKTKYAGTEEGLQRAVESCSPVPLVVAGGPAGNPMETLRLAGSCIRAGAAGISFGRRIFGADDPAPLLRALKHIVHDGATPEDAYAKYLASETRATDGGE